MSIGKIISRLFRIPKSTPPPAATRARPPRRSERDIYFTQNFHARARQLGLSEGHARYVFYEGDTVQQSGKPTNMKVAAYNGEEIGIYVFRDRETNQPVITSIWKRTFSSEKHPPSRR